MWNVIGWPTLACSVALDGFTCRLAMETLTVRLPGAGGLAVLVHPSRADRSGRERGANSRQDAHAACGGECSTASSPGWFGALSELLIRPAPHVSAVITLSVKNSTTMPPAVNNQAGTPGSRSRCRIDTSNANGRVPLVSIGISGTGIASSAGAQIGTAANVLPSWTRSSVFQSPHTGIGSVDT